MYLCWYVQSERHLGPPAEAETDWLVFSHSDAGIGETGESWSQESGPNRCKREGCGCLCHPENTLQTLQLLHRESARYVYSVSLRLKRGKRPIFLCHVLLDLQVRGQIQQPGGISEATQTREKPGVLQVCETRVDLMALTDASGTCLQIAISFCLLSSSTCACVEYFGRALETLIKKVTVCCIHGKMKDKRNKIFADFRALKR